MQKFPFDLKKILSLIAGAMVANLLAGCVSNDHPMMAGDNFISTGASVPMATHAPKSPGNSQSPATSKANSLDVIKAPQ